MSCTGGRGTGAVRLPVVPDGRAAAEALHEGRGHDAAADRGSGGDVRERSEGLSRCGEEETREIQGQVLRPHCTGRAFFLRIVAESAGTEGKEERQCMREFAGTEGPCTLLRVEIRRARRWEDEGPEDCRRAERRRQ